MHTFELSSKRIHVDEVMYNSLMALTAQNNDSIKIKMEPCNTTIITQKNEWVYFIVQVDCLALLQKRNVKSKTEIQKIKDTVNRFLLPAGTCVDDYKVIRVDYCRNTYIPNSKIRKCMFELLNKMPANTNYLRQGKDYIGKNVEYPMGSLRKNKSRALQIYDKSSHRRNYGEKEAQYERYVIREELQMKPEGLKYRRKADGVSDTFDYWINLDTEKRYLKLARKIFPKADFWSYDKAVDIINSSDYKPTMKAKLITYITEICRVESMDEVPPSLGSEQTIKGYIKRLEAINVNPVTIPNAKGIDKIRNPMY